MFCGDVHQCKRYKNQLHMVKVYLSIIGVTAVSRPTEATRAHKIEAQMRGPGKAQFPRFCHYGSHVKITTFQFKLID